MIGLPFGILTAPPPQTISYQGITFFIGATDIGTALSVMQVNGDGTIDRLGNQASNGVASWAQNIGPSFDPIDYDFRVDAVSGSLGWFPSNPTGVWIPGSAGIVASWGCEESSNSINAFGGTFRVRPTGGGADLITQVISIEADNTP